MASEAEHLLEQAKPHAEYWKRVLGLGDWQIVLEVSDIDKDRYAEIEVLPDTYRTKISVNTSFYEISDIDEPDLERTILHELLHVAIGHYAQSVTAMIEEEIGGQSGRVLCQRFRDEEERTVDRLSIALLNNKRREQRWVVDGDQVRPLNDILDAAVRDG